MYKTVCLLMLLTAGCATGLGQSSTTKANASLTTYPRVVAKVAVIGQTAAIPTTTIFTPSKNGLFRISAYGTITVITQNGTPELTFGWTDNGGAQQMSFPINNTQTPWFSGAGPAFYSFPVRANTGTPITFGMTVCPPTTCGDGGDTYDLYITVEQLM
jgi:hypothetical protein